MCFSGWQGNVLTVCRTAEFRGNDSYINRVFNLKFKIVLTNMCFETISVNIYGAKPIPKIALYINIYVRSNCCIRNCSRPRISKINNLHF